MTASRSNPGPKFYVPGNRVGAVLLLVFPLIGGGLAAVIGLAYAFVSGLITQVFESRALFILATPLFGAGLALAGRAVCYLGEVRRGSLRLPIQLAVGLLGYYFSWHAYLNLLDGVVFDPPVSWTMSPARVFHAMGELAAGHGVMLTLAWLIEIATIAGMIFYLQTSDDDPGTPFCETCNSWTSLALHFELADIAASAAAQHLEQGDAAGLSTLERHSGGALSYALVRVNHCGCGASRFVSVHRAKVELGKDAQLSHHSIVGKRHIYFDPGSPDETHLTPVLVDLVIDEPTERTLDAVRETLKA